MALDLLIDSATALPTRLRSSLRRQVARMVKAAALTEGRTDFDVALRLCGDPAIRELNRSWRGKDKPTDVLAFPQRGTSLVADLAPHSLHSASLLGDIVISIETAKRQAQRGLAAELLHLASHGLCHLLGYDHRTDAEEAMMNARAAALRREANRSGKIRAA